MAIPVLEVPTMICVECGINFYQEIRFKESKIEFTHSRYAEGLNFHCTFEGVKVVKDFSDFRKIL